MAADGEVTIASEQVQRLLQCAICLDRFKQPKLLPCQHTFCLSPCLEGLVEHRTRSLRCPECRADHFIPRSGVASFPNNLTIIGFLSLSETSNAEQARDELRSPPNRTAERVEVLEDNSLQVLHVRDNGREDGGCYVCHRQTTIQRCCHCECLVCEDCHREHLNLIRNELGRLIGDIRRGLPLLTDQIMAARRQGTQLQSKRENVKTEITEGVEKLIRELRARERTLHEEVDSFYRGEMRNLRTFQENAEVETASLSSFCDTAECLLGERRRIPNGDLIETKRQCEEHAETVQNYEDGSIRSPTTKQIQLSLESPFLSSTISNWGELIISSRASRRVMTPLSHESSSEFASRQASARHNLAEEDDQGFRGGNDLHPYQAAPPPRSPSALRRDRSHQNQPQRVQQVTFAEEERPMNGEDSYRWDSVSCVTRPNRRSRQERLSDTTAMNILSGPSLSQRLADRRRHQSLGGFTFDELDSMESYDSPRERHHDHGYSDFLNERRDNDFRDNNYSSSFPGARSSNVLSQPIHLDDSPRVVLNGRNDFFDSPTSLSSILSRNSRYVDTPRNRYNQKGSAVTQVGTRGSGSGQFTWPRGLAVSHLDDRIYVSDSSNHRVQIFDSTGRFIKAFGTYGQNEGEFDCLAGIAVSNLGQIVVSDRYNHRIQVFDRNGLFQNLFGKEGSSDGELNYPWGVACDNMGFIYVCDKENHRVQVFQSNGTFVRTIGEPGNRVGQLDNPHYVAVSQDNKVYISDSSNHRIQVFSIYGDFLFSFGVPGSLRGQMKFPRGIAIDNQGFAVVADSGNNRIQVFRSDGRFYSMFGNWGSENGQFKGLEGVAIQANGNIVISDRENHRFQIF